MSEQKVETSPGESPASFAADAPARAPAPDAAEAGNIRRIADGLTVLSILFTVAGGVAAVVGLYKAIAGDDISLAFICAGSLIGVAFWLFLLAQIIHVRSLLAKK